MEAYGVAVSASRPCPPALLRLPALPPPHAHPQGAPLPATAPPLAPPMPHPPPSAPLLLHHPLPAQL